MGIFPYNNRFYVLGLCFQQLLRESFRLELDIDRVFLKMSISNSRGVIGMLKDVHCFKMA
jgi:hypothetical protein